MMVDDAHASGVFGKNGSGTVDHFKCHGRVDIQVGTLSKAIGVLGGYVAGSKNLIEFLYHRARPFLFSTSHPPAVTAACIAALDVLETEPQWIEQLWDNTRFFKAGLEKLGFNTGLSESPITPVIVGEAATAARMSDALFAQGRVRPEHRLSRPSRATRPGCAPSSPPRTRKKTCSTPSTRSARSDGNSASFSNVSTSKWQMCPRRSSSATRTT